MPTVEDLIAAYEDATDGCRYLIRDARDNSQNSQRVKPDPETNPLSELDWEREATWNEPLVTTPLPHLSAGSTDCTALAIPSLVLFARPTRKDLVDAM